LPSSPSSRKSPIEAGRPCLHSDNAAPASRTTTSRNWRLVSGVRPRRLQITVWNWNASEPSPGPRDSPAGESKGSTKRHIQLRQITTGCDGFCANARLCPCPVAARRLRPPLSPLSPAEVGASRFHRFIPRPEDHTGAVAEEYQGGRPARRTRRQRLPNRLRSRSPAWRRGRRLKERLRAIDRGRARSGLRSVIRRAQLSSGSAVGIGTDDP